MADRQYSTITFPTKVNRFTAASFGCCFEIDFFPYMYIYMKPHQYHIIAVVMDICMAWRKTAATPLLAHWGYFSLRLSHQYIGSYNGSLVIRLLLKTRMNMFITPYSVAQTRELRNDANARHGIRATPLRCCLSVLLLIYSISQEICTRFCCALLCCGYVIVHNEFKWSIYPYSSGLLCWHWGNRQIATVPMK